MKPLFLTLAIVFSAATATWAATGIPTLSTFPLARTADINSLSNALFIALSAATNASASAARAYADIVSTNNHRIVAGANVTISQATVGNVLTTTIAVPGGGGSGGANLTNAAGGVGIAGESTGTSPIITPIKGFNPDHFETNAASIGIKRGASVTNFSAFRSDFRGPTNTATALEGRFSFEGAMGETNHIYSSDEGWPILLDRLGRAYTNWTPTAGALLNYLTMQHLFAVRSNATISAGLLLPHLTASRAVVTDANSRLTNSSLTSAALEALASSDQFLAGKIKAAAAVTNLQGYGISLINATASKVAILDADKGLTNSSVDATDLANIAGGTSPFQSQIDLLTPLTTFSGGTNELWENLQGPWTQLTDPSNIDMAVPRQLVIVTAAFAPTFSNTNDGMKCSVFFILPSPQDFTLPGITFPQGTPTNSWSGMSWFTFAKIGGTNYGFYDGIQGNFATTNYVNAATNGFTTTTYVNTATNALAGVVNANILSSSNVHRSFTISVTNALASTNFVNGAVSNVFYLRTNLVTHLIGTNAAALTNLSFNFDQACTVIYLTNNVTLTNWTGLGAGAAKNIRVHIRPQLVPRTITWSSLGVPALGAHWKTNANSPVYAVLTNGVEYVLSASTLETNVFVSLTAW